MIHDIVYFSIYKPISATTYLPVSRDVFRLKAYVSTWRFSVCQTNTTHHLDLKEIVYLLGGKAVEYYSYTLLSRVVTILSK